MIRRRIISFIFTIVILPSCYGAEDLSPRGIGPFGGELGKGGLLKAVGGFWGNRPPAHDSPPAACSCGLKLCARTMWRRSKVIRKLPLQRTAVGEVSGLRRELADAYTHTRTCGERNDPGRVVGGQAAAPQEFPWMARLSYFNKFYCGGTLISDRYVLTAAHCVKGFMWFMIRATFGEHDRCNETKHPESRFVLRAITHDFSFSNFDNDIALLRLNDRVPISENLHPVCLPSNQKNAYVAAVGTVSGWGTLKEDGKPSCILQEVELPVISNKACRNTSYAAKMISDNMLCAGYPEKGMKDSCQGDSGGPLVTERADHKYEIIGVVSWGNGCARKGYPGVYSRITRYIPWIKEHTRDSCFCTE